MYPSFFFLKLTKLRRKNCWIFYFLFYKHINDVIVIAFQNFNKMISFCYRNWMSLKWFDCMWNSFPNTIWQEKSSCYVAMLTVINQKQILYLAFFFSLILIWKNFISVIYPKLVLELLVLVIQLYIFARCLMNKTKKALIYTIHTEWQIKFSQQQMIGVENCFFLHASWAETRV